MKRRFIVFLIATAMASAAPAITEPGSRNAALLHAVRSGDVARIKMMLDEGADANAMDASGTPAIMHSVLYASPQVLKLLIERGANVNAKASNGATALLWGAGDAEKARMLIAAGADVNATSDFGRTPLHVAASVAGGAQTVKLLIEKGATIDARDKLEGIPVIFSGAGKGTPLIDAARVGDIETVTRLLRAGADVNATDGRSGTALSEATVFGRRDLVKLLLENHASTKVAVSVLKFPLLSLAAMRGDMEIARMLIAAGAEVNATDVAGMTPLMWAANTDRVNPAIVQMYLNAGADVKAITKSGDSALDYAAQRGDTRIFRMLREAGAPQKEATAVAAPAKAENNVSLEQTIALLAQASEVATKKAGCASCHHHTLPLVAFGAAKSRGIPVNEQVESKNKAVLLGMLKPFVPIMLEGSGVAPDLPVTGGLFLEALAAQQYPADLLTAAMVNAVAAQQNADGRWSGVFPRTPLESGDIQATAMSIRALRLYMIPGRRAELETRIARAGRWLRTAQPATTEEYAMRMLGLKWAGMDAAEIKDAGRQLVRLQRADGGWSQLTTLSSDAYATAKAIYALREAFGEQADSLAVRNGSNYLRKTQLADGSWHVKTRSYPFQPLSDQGFPHGRDQWISMAATGYAVLALMP